ncbi:MAG: porin [Candidatus Latescibacteria bacterium]|nr:porin [Candidatus Latescibacterota bacterium]
MYAAPFRLKAALIGGCIVAFSSAGAESPALSGFIDATYNRNLQSGDSGPTTNQHHSFDAQANSFLLNAVHLAATGSSGEELSYAIEVDMGTDAAAINSGGLGTGDEMDLQEAYVTYRKPDSKLGFKAGKFVTYNGIEVIESGANPTVTRGYLFGLAEPYTHTGIVATYQLSQALDVHLGAVNGWDLFVDNNTRPTGVVKLGYSGGDPLALTVSAYLGPEQAGNTDDSRMSVDATGVSKSVKNLDLWFQVNYGSEAKVAAGEDASWLGFGLQPLYHFSEKTCLGVRYEYFKDSDGARSGTTQALQNISIAPAYYLTKSLLSRLEVRADMSDEDVFTDSDGEATGQQLQVAAEMIYSF